MRIAKGVIGKLSDLHKDKFLYNEPSIVKKVDYTNSYQNIKPLTEWELMRFKARKLEKHNSKFGNKRHYYRSQKQCKAIIEKHEAQNGAQSSSGIKS